MKEYNHPFGEKLVVSTPEEAVQVITHFCDYCKKDGISRFHCAGRDSLLCEKVKEDIVKDFRRTKKGAKS